MKHQPPKIRPRYLRVASLCSAFAFGKFFSANYDLDSVLFSNRSIASQNSHPDVTLVLKRLFPKHSTVVGQSMRLAPRFGFLGDKAFSRNNTIVRRTIADTNFVTTWVVAAFLLFELSVYFFGLDLKNLFTGMALYTPLMAVLVGFIPGCGPQVLVTTMYLSGIIPLSALLGNAISNDGDALFPAIAIAPRVAIVATLYSALPALLISYGWFFLVEQT